MKVIKRMGIPIYTFDLFSDCPDISHGIFPGKYHHPGERSDSLNISFSDHFSKESVNANRDTIINKLGDSTPFFLNQVHGTDVVVYPDGKEGDASVTDQKKISLVIQTADCQAVMLYDTHKKVIANIHSGWRGSVSDIIGHTIRTMEHTFLSRPVDILAGIGPSLGPCCSEFVNYKKEIPEKFWGYKDEKHRFDFWNISRDQLTEAGVKKENIETMNLCTKCRSDVFYSYRKDKTKGRFANVIHLVD